MSSAAHWPLGTRYNGDIDLSPPVSGMHVPKKFESQEKHGSQAGHPTYERLTSRLLEQRKISSTPPQGSIDWLDSFDRPHDRP
jgi:hypothetical protein